MTPAFIGLVAASVVANMAIGSVWYMPKVFGTMWMKDVHIDFSKMKKQAMIKAMTGSAISYAVVAAFLGYARQVAFAGTTEQWLISLVIMWLIFVLCIRVSHALFEQKSIRYIAITCGHDLAGILATGLIMYYA